MSNIHKLKRLLRRYLHNTGVDIRRVDPACGPVTQEDCREAIMWHHKISLVVDVGANIGQYASGLRKNGYQGRIISYEPLKEPFEKLERASSNDKNWEVNNFAIGSESGYCDINVSQNSMSSSLLPMLATHVANAPESVYISQERVKIETLDSVFRPGENDATLLKIDTQGYERQVIEGAAETLKKISLIECELSLVPLYSGQELFTPMLEFFRQKGFMPISFHRAFSDLKTGHALQVDGMFCRTE